VAHPRAGMIDHAAALQDQVETLRHWLIHCKAKATCVSSLADYLQIGKVKVEGLMDELVCLLRDRGVIEVGGADATGFLQRLITNSVLNIPKGEGRYAGLLTPQGKLLFDFFVVPLAEGQDADYLMDGKSERPADLVKRLNLHKMRAKIAIED